MASLPTQPSSSRDDPYFATLSSIMRVTVAGFGGALAGLSFARRGAVGGAATVGKQTAKTVAAETPAWPRGGKGGQKKRLPKQQRLQQRPIVRSTPPTTRPYVDRELPYAWAVACTAFAGIIEFTRVVSPTTIVWEMAKEGGGLVDTKNNDDNNNIGEEEQQSSSSDLLDNTSMMMTISDHIIGGAIAGALFRGSAVRTQMGARIDASIMGITPTSKTVPTLKGRPLSGILPGAALGLLAGIAIVATDYAQVVIEEKYGHLDYGNTVDDDDATAVVQDMGNEDTIPADIKAMSNEELMRSIEELKRRKGESSGGNTNTNRLEDVSNENDDSSQITVQAGHENEARDLLSAIGFRQHPSL